MARSSLFQIDAVQYVKRGRAARPERWPGWRDDGFRGNGIEYVERRYDSNRRLRNTLQFRLPTTTIETDVAEVSTVPVERIAKRLDLHGVMIVMPRHLLFMLRRAVWAIMAGLHGDRTRLQREIQPHGREHSQGPETRGAATGIAVSLAFQCVVTNTISSRLLILDSQDYG